MNTNKSSSFSRDLLWIRYLIWTYFWLLIFEGALRKWILPFASTPLLLVRDPIVILAYILALRSGVFPRNVFMFVGGFFALFSLIAGWIVLQGNILVPIYGLHTNFLQLPLIFLIPKVFKLKDVQRVGYWILIVSMPMAILMVMQFRAGSTSWLNVGANEGSKQLDLVGDYVRASGTFSYTNGPAFFYALVSTFLLYSLSISKYYPRWLVVCSTLSLISAASVCGSRSFLAGIAMVVGINLINAIIFKPILAFRLFYGLIIILLFSYFMGKLSFVQEGVSVFAERITNAGISEGGAEGFTDRAFKQYTEAMPLLLEVPLLGYGLGVGTNAGSALLTGTAQFLLAETEWSRIVLESGSLLGGGFILYRVCLTFRIGLAALHRMTQHDSLALLLFGACGFNLLNGQWGPPTSLGFTIFVSGLCLTAARPSSRLPIESVKRVNRSRKASQRKSYILRIQKHS